MSIKAADLRLPRARALRRTPRLFDVVRYCRYVGAFITVHGVADALNIHGAAAAKCISALAKRGRLVPNRIIGWDWRGPIGHLHHCRPLTGDERKQRKYRNTPKGRRAQSRSWAAWYAKPENRARHAERNRQWDEDNRLHRRGQWREVKRRAREAAHG